MSQFLYTTHVERITLDTYKEPLTIWAFGDVHRDTKSCDVGRWNDWINKAKKDNAYFIGMGDYHDFASTSEKKRLISGDLHDTTIELFDEIVQRQNRKFVEEIGFMRGRVLALVDGNHNWVLSNGKTSTDDLAERMQAKSVGWMCHFTLVVSFKNRPKDPVALRFVLCHGKAGGKTAGITINQVDDLRRIFPVADFYIQGHDHQRGAWPTSVLVPCQSSHEIKQKRQLLCRSGSFKRAYVDGHAGYEVKSMYKPSDLGALGLHIDFYREGNGPMKYNIGATI